MMNAIWFWLMMASIITAAFTGTMSAVSTASVESAKAAVTLALGLIGVMAFWLGMMRIVQQAGLLHLLARWLRPLMTRLFPSVPPDHPAMSAMILNIASNMLGLGNAATPFGIKAMLELNQLNPRPGVATNEMVLFLAINTSHLAIAPLGVIALRASIGSAHAAAIWVPTLLATALAMVVGVSAAKLLQRVFPPVTAYESAAPIAVDDLKAPDEQALAEPPPTSAGGCAVAVASVAALVSGLAVQLHRATVAGTSLSDAARAALSDWTLPLLIVVMLAYGFAKRVAIYDAMIAGAREGFETAVRIIPFLVAIVVAAGMFRASGLLDGLVRTVGPYTDAVGFPAAALPMALLRPLSGSGAYAVMAEIMKAEGPDSHVGYLVSVLQGSTETTFYVLAVYFGAVAVTRVRHAVAAGLIADLAGFVGATLAVNWLLVR